MPDFDRLRQTLAERGGIGPCPSCGVNLWIAGDDLLLLQSVGPNNEVRIGTGVPLMMLACGNCGFCRFHLIPTLENPPVRAESPTGTEDDQQS